MTDSKDVGEVLAEALGFVLNRTERSLESFLEGEVDGLAAFRELGVDSAEGKEPIRLFVYDYLPKLKFLNDIKVRPNHYQATPTVFSQLKRCLYDRFFVGSGGELFEVHSDDFRVLFNGSTVYHFQSSKTTDYFYV